MEVRVKEDLGDLNLLDIEDNILNVISETAQLLVLVTGDDISLPVKVRISQIYESHGLIIVLLTHREISKLKDWARLFEIDHCLYDLCNLVDRAMLKRIARDPYQAVLKNMSDQMDEIERLEKQQARTLKKKELFLYAYRHTNGNVSRACEHAEIKSRKTFYNWCETDPEFKKALDQVFQMKNDFAEDMLMIDILKGKGKAIRYFLSRRSPEYMPIKRVHVPPKRKSEPWVKWADMSKVDTSIMRDEDDDEE